MKFSTIATDTTNNNFKLKSVMKKGKLPKNINQLKNWMLEYLLETKDVNGFQEIAFLIENNYEDEYKWQYLSSIYAINKDIKERALQEIKIIKLRNKLTDTQVSNIENNAQIWIDLNWK